MGKKRKKSKKKFEEPEDVKKAPHSFILKWGPVNKPVNELMMDMRTLMEPFTARNLKVTKYNVVKDFVSVASLLHVTHMTMFTMTERSVYMRVCRLPRGPTIAFKVNSFCLARDVRSSIRKPVANDKLFRHHPLLVMNGFTTDDMKVNLTASMFRNMFPSFDINNVDLNDIKRCVLLNYNPETGEIDFRHYAVRVKPVGLSRVVRKLASSKKIPDLGRFKDMADVVAKDGTLTESEGEEDAEDFRQVTLPQNLGVKKGNIAQEKSAIRLTELGPRMTLSFFKIEEGLMEGEVLYHSVVKKTPQEIQKLKEKKRREMREKEFRKKQQEENVRKKRPLDEEDEEETDEEERQEEEDKPAKKIRGILKKPVKSRK